MRRISVSAVGEGWRLTVDGLDNDMLFRSGAEAERAARGLADRLADAGDWSEIRLHLKDGSLAARFLSLGRAPAPAVAKEAGAAATLHPA